MAVLKKAVCHFGLILAAMVVACAPTKQVVYYSEDKLSAQEVEKLFEKTTAIYDLYQINDLINSLYHVDYHFPDSLNDRHIYAQTLIGQDRSVRAVRLSKSINATVDSLVIHIAKASKYRQFKVGGDPVAFSLLLPFVFEKNEIKIFKIPTRSGKAPSEEQISEKLSKPGSPPMPKGGFNAIRKKLIYPRVAAIYGVEERVVLNVFLDEDGRIGPYYRLQAHHKEFVDAAYTAVSSVEWVPCKVDEKKTGVWIGVPVVFKLNKR